MPIIRPSTSSFFKPPPAEYIRTAGTATILDVGAKAAAALGMAKADRVATGRATARDTVAADRRMANRNISTVYVYVYVYVYASIEWSGSWGEVRRSASGSGAEVVELLVMVAVGSGRSLEVENWGGQRELPMMDEGGHDKFLVPGTI